jgi:osmotically-inducible protein OsmY
LFAATRKDTWRKPLQSVLPECWPSPTTRKCACLTWTRDRIPRSARDAIAQIKNELPYAWENIRVVVKNARLTLEGEVEWNYQRDRAEAAVRRVRGVEGVTNAIEVKPRVAPTEIRRKIEDALRRAADIDATHVTVETNGSEVILRGTVRSWAERQEAEKAAWAAPGVARVDNRIIISP